MKSSINALADGKFEVTWPVHTARSLEGRIISGRPETVAALTRGAKPFSVDEVVKVYGTRAAAERQL